MIDILENMAPGASSEARQTRQSKTNSQSSDSVTSIKEILESAGFKELITNAVRSAVREELKGLKESFDKLTVQLIRMSREF